MGGIISKPKAPAPAPIPAPPPAPAPIEEKLDEPEIDLQEEQRKKRARRKGRKSTIVSGGLLDSDSSNDGNLLGS